MPAGTRRGTRGLDTMEQYYTVFGEDQGDDFVRYWASISTEKRNKDGEGTGKYAQATIQVRMSKELKQLFEDEAVKTKNKKVRMLRIKTSEFCLMAAASKDKNIDDYVYLYIKDGDVAEEKKAKSKKSKQKELEDEEDD